ncbi:tRNA (guanine(10)-N(2))-dimethyltransferase [Candidatus Woesearchaeota archaeon]|nr:tRNA (guanine(10)-N(2))-dimethyltransferase [Candidatus Woesearchaeota archaeon]
MGKKHGIVVEGKAKLAVPKYGRKAVSSRMPVFYNPVMKSNRDITILLMEAAAKLYGIKKWAVADPMAATGIRGIRMVLELENKNIEGIKMNDYSDAAAALIKKNMRRNRIKTGGKISVTVNEANKFLLNNKPFNYIDIDPFGYPGLFLDTAVKRLRHNGILAVTATDTSALAGTAVAACRRKYLATPLRNGFMHETGIRILIRLAQLIGAMHEKALTPVFSYYKDHYIRAFLLCRTGSGRCDDVLSKHKEILYCDSCCEKKIGEGGINPCCSNCGKQMLKAGLLWAGNLFDRKLAVKMVLAAANPNRAKSSIGPRRLNGDVGNRYGDEKIKTFLKVVAEEAAGEGKCGAGFYAIEDVCEKHGIGQQPKTTQVIKRLQQKGYNASQTHCTTTGVKTNAPLKVFLAVVKGK